MADSVGYRGKCVDKLLSLLDSWQTPWELNVEQYKEVSSLLVRRECAHCSVIVADEALASDHLNGAR